MEAVNEGNIFRFLTKPCHPDTLDKAITSGIEQNRLITAERELLEKTLKKLYQGETLSGEEKQLFDMHPSIASDLLTNIPRLGEISGMIAYQEKHFDGSGIPSDSRRTTDIPLGARILKAVLDFDVLDTARVPKKEIIARMENRPGWYDPSVLNALKMTLGIDAKYEMRPVTIGELNRHMIFAEDVRSTTGRLLISKGQDVSRPLIERLRNYAQFSKVQEPIRVIVSVTEHEEPL